MKIFSMKRDFETDHSSTHTKYIMGFTVTCDYEWRTCEFELPYIKILFEKIKKYKKYGDYQLERGNRIKKNLISGFLIDFYLLHVCCIKTCVLATEIQFKPFYFMPKPYCIFF